MIQEFFISKTACLLHDPPTKAWDICAHRDHERRAREIASDILMGSILEGAGGKLGLESVARADCLAASIDRWLLSELIGRQRGKFPYYEIKIKNIFNPKFSYVIEKEIDYPKKFTEELNRILKPVNDPRLAYHILYASYEPLWILRNLPASPADTRAPSHSIFDHVYATASMMNWLIESERPKGLLLFIDLGGPQKFISSSRKLGDLWVSSYLASALAWSLFWILIKALGPDVMILPTCRGNAFYYHSLLSMLRNLNIDENIIKKIENISEEIASYNPAKDVIPKYAVVPVTATFMLPDLNILRKFDEFREIKSLEGLEKFLEKKYEEIWNRIYNKVIQECKKHVNELGSLAEYAANLLEQCKEFDFDKVPPLPLRVLVIHTDELYKLASSDKEGLRDYQLYHYMFKYLGYKLSHEKIYKFRPEEKLKLHDMTSKLKSRELKSWPEESKRGFDYCSVCGRLPAIIIMPSDKSGFEEAGLRLTIEPMFGFGERLCPYCLIKRLLNINFILETVMEELLGRASESRLEKREFLSVSDIALMPFKRSFIEVMKELDKSPDKEPIERFLNKMTEMWKSITSIIEVEAPGEIIREEPLIYREKVLLKDLEKLRYKELKDELKYILLLKSEAGILSKRELRTIWSNFIGDLKRDSILKRYVKNLEMIEPFNTYYAIIRSDGDSMGKIIHGKVKEGFRMNVDEYLINILEGDIKMAIQAIIQGKFNEAKSICERNNVIVTDKILKELNKLMNNLIKNGEILISPSYHSALSRALANSALRDAQVIDRYDGFIVYAGGDDLLAVMPVKNCLKAVKELRKSFSFPSDDYKGFYKVKEFLIPALATASRSFSVYLSHYMFPMYVAISRSYELMENLAKEVKWIRCNSKIREKDALVFSYSPRGGEHNALLPLSDVSDPESYISRDIERIQVLIEIIEAGKRRFSASLIYDLYSNFELIKPLIKNRNEFLLRSVLEQILDRNCEIADRTVRKDFVRQWGEKLMTNYDLVFKIRDEDEQFLFLEEFIKGLIIYRTGLRGVE